MAGQCQADGQEQHDLDLLGQHVEREGQQLLEGDPLLADGEHDAREAGFGEHRAGGRLRDVGGVGDRDSNLRLLERRRVVGAVAAHADHVVRALARLDGPEPFLRHDPREDAVLIAMDRVGQAPGRPDRSSSARRRRVSARLPRRLRTRL